MIINTDVCYHRKQRKQNKPTVPEITPNRGEIYVPVDDNSFYQELGELSKPAVYEKLKFP